MADSGIQIAETIQTASIKRSPSPRHDLNPSTAASKKEPVSIDPNGDGDDVDDDEIPYSVIRPERRKATLPPLPDLRFEQSYLASIAHAETHWRVAFITLRDQVFLPLVQGTLWTLGIQGWRYWNKSASFNGATVGSRVRRWWYGVNNWKIPNNHLRVNDERLASEVKEYYTGQFSNAGAD